MPDWMNRKLTNTMSGKKEYNLKTQMSLLLINFGYLYSAYFLPQLGQ